MFSMFTATGAGAWPPRPAREGMAGGAEPLPPPASLASQASMLEPARQIGVVSLVGDVGSKR